MTSAVNLWKEFDIIEEAGLEGKVKDAKNVGDVRLREWGVCQTVYEYFLPELRKEFYGKWIFILTPEQTKGKYEILIGPPTSADPCLDSIEELKQQYPQVTPFVMPLLDNVGVYSPR